MVGCCPRYNYHIKNYMIDMNRIKQVSQRSRRFALQSSAAVATLWPTESSKVTERLLETGAVGSGTMFQRLALGAVCVWQECQNVLQTCAKRNASTNSESAALEKVKAKLIAAVDEEDMKEIARCVQGCRRLNLLLHAKRMLTFIKNPHHISELNSAVARLSREYEELHPELGHVSLTSINRTLSSSFSPRQKENIGDFLEHLKEFFLPNVKEELSIKRWMICCNDHVFGVVNEKVPRVELGLQCSRCHPEISASKDDAGSEQEDIDTAINRLLHITTTSTASASSRVTSSRLLRYLSAPKTRESSSSGSDNEFDDMYL